MNRFLSDIAILIALVVLILITQDEYKIAAVVATVLQSIAIVWTYAPIRTA